MGPSPIWAEELEGSSMFENNLCQIAARLTQILDIAIIQIARLEEDHSLCPLQASERLVAAQAAWIEHKMTCQFCRGQQLGKIH